MIDKLCIRTQQFNFLFLIQGEFKNQCGGDVIYKHKSKNTARPPICYIDNLIF